VSEVYRYPSGAFRRTFSTECFSSVGASFRQVGQATTLEYPSHVGFDANCPTERKGRKKEARKRGV